MTELLFGFGVGAVVGLFGGFLYTVKVLEAVVEKRIKQWEAAGWRPPR